MKLILVLSFLKTNVSVVFDSILVVKPIATYNSEITNRDTYVSKFRAEKHANISKTNIDLLNFTDKSCLEKLHLSFCISISS